MLSNASKRFNASLVITFGCGVNNKHRLDDVNDRRARVIDAIAPTQMIGAFNNNRIWRLGTSIPVSIIVEQTNTLKRWIDKNPTSLVPTHVRAFAHAQS